MIMKIINSEEHLCTCCMEKHEVKTVLVREQATFKNVKITYDAVYFYCDTAEEFYMDEKLLQENDIRLKDAYREAENLLTSSEIIGQNMGSARLIYARFLDGVLRQLPVMKATRYRIGRMIQF